ncbi:MAG TPA: helix-turn-helix transcriptional regulator [Thermoanaerobaculia bacterium]|nr:helix-turn-helix transcriptional regulator [Thermoanaerobaculia bacterium]
MTETRDQEVQRLLEVLATVVRVAGRSRQSLERQIGLSSGYLSKILGGTVELRVQHILMIVEAVGLSPGDFFRLAYPPGALSAEAARLVDQVRAALGQEDGPDSAARTGFDEQVKASLGRLLGLAP